MEGVTISCDDYAVVVGKQTVYPRRGQTVTIRPTLPLALEAQRDDFTLRTSKFEGDPDELKSLYRELAEFLTGIVISWTWLNDQGEFMPTPSEDPDVVRRELSSGDIHWILGLYREAQVEVVEKKEGS